MSWRIYQGTGIPHDGLRTLPPPPPWRAFAGVPQLEPPAPPDGSPEGGNRLVSRGAAYHGPDDLEIDAVNAALLLRRPLLVTGKPGTGKSTLAYAVAHELRMGPVLHWPIVSRTTVTSGLYEYDALGRVQDAALAERGEAVPQSIGDYLRLGPLGTALLPYALPRALLIDEIDKSDLDFPNDLLTVFEEAEFTIPELARIAVAQPSVDVGVSDSTARAAITGGRVRAHAFPFILLTSNGERQFPPAFLRRCVRLELGPPSPERLARIVAAHLGEERAQRSVATIERFLAERADGDLATDQLLNSIHVLGSSVDADDATRDRLLSLLLRSLNST